MCVGKCELTQTDDDDDEHREHKSHLVLSVVGNMENKPHLLVVMFLNGWEWFEQS